MSDEDELMGSDEEEYSPPGDEDEGEAEGDNLAGVKCWTTVAARCRGSGASLFLRGP